MPTVLFDSLPPLSACLVLNKQVITVLHWIFIQNADEMTVHHIYPHNL